MKYREGFVREELAKTLMKDAGLDPEQAADVITALAKKFGEPEIDTRTRGGYRMDSRWNEHQLVFPWQDGLYR